MPRLIYVADHSLAGYAMLSGCDRDIQTCVKTWLHLEPHTVDGLCYASCKDGGLGLLRLAAIQLCRLLKMYNLAYACTKAVAHATIKLNFQLGIWCRAQGMSMRSMAVAPTDVSDLDLQPISAAGRREAEFAKWCSWSGG